jgi:hypothetical protein
MIDAERFPVDAPGYPGVLDVGPLPDASVRPSDASILLSDAPAGPLDASFVAPPASTTVRTRT